jgi:hypothetical protein
MTHATRRNTAAARFTTRDKVSNGRLFRNVDLRSSAARRFRVLVDAYEAELGGELTEAERSLARQAVALQLKGEMMQAAIVRGEIVDADQLIRVSSTSKRLLGIIAGRTGQRKPPPGPTLQEYLAAKAAAQAEDDTAAADVADDEPEAADPS